MRSKALVVLLFVTLVVSAAIFFFPKERVIGGLRGGPIAPGESAYREDYRCIGFAYDWCPNWPDYGCDYLCYGVVTRQSCTIEKYDPVEGVTQSETACAGPARPGWGFPGK